MFLIQTLKTYFVQGTEGIKRSLIQPCSSVILSNAYPKSRTVITLYASMVANIYFDHNSYIKISIEGFLSRGQCTRS